MAATPSVNHLTSCRCTASIVIHSRYLLLVEWSYSHVMRRIAYAIAGWALDVARSRNLAALPSRSRRTPLINPQQLRLVYNQAPV